MYTLKICTYNIHHGQDAKNTLNLWSIYKVLRLIDADIFALQEVDMGRPQTMMVKQARLLSGILSLEYVYTAVKHYNIGSYGNAILSKYPIVNYTNHYLSDSTDPRCCLQADICFADTLLSVFNTHMGLKQPVRCRQIRETIIPLIKPLNHPAILAGDFNAPPTRPEIQLLSAEFKDTFQKNSGLLSLTFPSLNPQARIDYIFVNDYCQTNNYYILESTASDHLPVTAQINISSSLKI